MQIKCKINGSVYEFEAQETQRALDIIRGFGITSVKEGCGEGECGACTLYFNGKLVNSCLLLAAQMDACEIITLDGLLQETEMIRKHFVKEGAVQCGFCTGGFVLRAYDYAKEGGSSDEEAIKAALDGNICRCTGYYKIVEAVKKSLS